MASEETVADVLKDLAALSPPEKARMRRVIRRRISECMRLLTRKNGLPPEQRAYVRGFLDESRKALAVVSDG